MLFDFSTQAIIQYLFRLPALLLAISFHEMMHGWTAYKLGDYTAKLNGRLSMNPLSHIDPIGAICMVLVGFGWAKPVMVNPYNLKKPKRDMALVSLAGPLANLLLGFIGAVIFVVATLTLGKIRNEYIFWLILFIQVFAQLNIGFAIFNLIPLPPLDGSKVLFSILPNKLYYKYLGFERYGMIILFALIMMSNFSNGPSVFGFLYIANNAIFSGMISAILAVLKLFGI